MELRSSFDWRRHGIATVLLHALLHGRPEDVTELVTQVDVNNQASLALLARVGRLRTSSPSCGVVDVHIPSRARIGQISLATRLTGGAARHRHPPGQPERASNNRAHATIPLRRLLGPGQFEVTCDVCFAELDRYVELAGADADAAVPGMAAHLNGCPACGEEHASLTALLTEPDQPVDPPA